MNPAEIRSLFERYDAVRSGHFVLSSGRHSEVYVQCARVLEHPSVGRSLGSALASRFPQGASVVLSPAVGAILIGSAVAEAINARFVFAERAEGALALRRGQHIEARESVLVVEDVVTTGESARECVELARAAAATVVGVGSLVDRTHAAPPFRLESLMRVAATSYQPADCPACARGIPTDSPGSRRLRT